MHIRYWAAIVSALATAALVDWSSEVLANAGWLGGLAASDGHQEAVFPVVVLTALVAVTLGLIVALRAGRGEQTRYRAFAPSQRIVTAIASVAAVFAVIALMEAYEMRFGEISALDPRSVFVEHWPAVCIGYVVVASIVGRIVDLLLGFAAAAGRLAVNAVVRFLRVDRSAHASMACTNDSRGARIVQRAHVLEFGTLGLRAPPPLQLLSLQQLLP